MQAKKTSEENKKRLQEIAEMQFGTLLDDDILRLLAERKRLLDLEREYEKIQEEEASRREREKETAALEEQEKKKATIIRKIEELNKSISPEKPDEDLLALVAQRKEFEKELEELGTSISLRGEEVLSEIAPPAQPRENTLSDKGFSKPEPKAGVSEADSSEEKISSDEEKETSYEVPSQEPETRSKEEYGGEKISSDGIETGSEFQRYFDQLKNNVGSLGELLQNMPLDAKKNKAFMLKVAEIDPAYAMHYADKETLKKDEDFNLRIASLRNPRNSGNALAEMLPEARTSKVLLAAVKQDYRNVRFIQPNMADYDEMMGLAKKGALEKVINLKEAADIILLIPKLLQQDKQFMLQVKEATESRKGE